MRAPNVSHGLGVGPGDRLSGVTRRSPARFLLVAAAVAALGGCATFENADLVARVGDTDIDQDDFNRYADEYFAEGNPFQTPLPQQGRADAEVSRLLVGALVQQEAFRGFVAAYDLDATQVRQAFIATLSGTPGEGLSDEMKGLIADVDGSVRSQVLAGVPTPSVDELRAMYADDPAAIGLLCMRHILVATESEAEAVLDELAGGADFAALAEERSIDPTAAGNGGAVTGGSENQCIPLATVLGSYDPDFTAAALAAREGVPSEPVRSSFGWHVILHRPWDEIADSVAQLHQPGDSGGYLFDGYLATADIAIDPRYGHWNQLTASVDAVG